MDQQTFSSNSQGMRHLSAWDIYQSSSAVELLCKAHVETHYIQLWFFFLRLSDILQVLELKIKLHMQILNIWSNEHTSYFETIQGFFSVQENMWNQGEISKLVLDLSHSLQE